MLFDKETYLDTRDKGMKLYNQLSDKYLFWAFNQDQFDDGIAKLEASIGGKAGKDWKVTSVGAGGYCYTPKVKEVCAASRGGKKAVIANLGHNDFTRGAFLYEMCNHEYPINWQGDWDVCACFTRKEPIYGEDKTYRDYLSEAGYGEDVILAYKEAREECFKKTADWY